MRAFPRLGRVLRALVIALPAFVLAGEAPSVAQAPPPPFITGTPAEDEAYALYKDDKLIGARTKAQAALNADPDSIIGHFVMGKVLHEAEGVLPRAMYHLGRARELFETRWGSQPGPASPWRFHQELVLATARLAGEMEEYDYQLELYDFHDALYEPDAIAEHAWALVHLGRFDDARKAARDAIASRDVWQRTLGRNALCAVEGEARTRAQQYEACQAALADAQRRSANDPKEAKTDPTKGTAVAVHAYNAALAAYAVLRYDEVERLAREGAKRTEFTPANPWRILTRLYLDSGRVAEAVAAVREMHGWRVRQPANLRDQDRAEGETALATLLLVAGEGPAGLALASRALERPDRRGLTSSRPEQAAGASALLRRSLRILSAELAAERASVSGTAQRARYLAESVGHRLAVRPDEERILAVLADDTRLDSTFRFYLSGGIEPVPTWLLGDLVSVLGPGVTAVVVERARDEEKEYPLLGAYFDAIDAEIALARREPERALRLARASLEALPKAEALFAARTAAVGAAAARKLGDASGEVALLARAMTSDPGVIRRMGLSIPTTVTVRGGDEVLERAAVLALRSPRLYEAGGAFELLLERAGAQWTACLRSPEGSALSCSAVSAVADEAPEDRAARLMVEFHRNAFAMRVGLTQADLKGLDGSNGLAGEAQREQMQKLLRDMADEEP